MKIFITGASGFIGSALCSELASIGHEITGLVRKPHQKTNANINYLQLEDISLISVEHLVSQDIVFHTAGLAHQINEDSTQYRQVNVEGSTKLAETCVLAGVPRLINLSSTKAVGEGSVGAGTTAAPKSPYGVSKREAELRLMEIASHSELDVISLRIPLTYGLGVKGNFPRLITLARRCPLLPLSSLNAQRSYLYLANLLDFLTFCLTHDKFQQDCLYVCDPEPVSLRELLGTLSIAQGRKLFNLPVPSVFVTFLARRILSASLYTQLFKDCKTDISETVAITQWNPKYTTIEGIHHMFGNDLDAR